MARFRTNFPNFGGIMHPWHDTYIDEQLIATAFPVIIEIPKGSTNKAESQSA
jgi:hypothetical protein